MCFCLLGRLRSYCLSCAAGSHSGVRAATRRKKIQKLQADINCILYEGVDFYHAVQQRVRYINKTGCCSYDVGLALFHQLTQLTDTSTAFLLILLSCTRATLKPKQVSRRRSSERPDLLAYVRCNCHRARAF